MRRLALTIVSVLALTLPAYATSTPALTPPASAVTPAPADALSAPVLVANPPAATGTPAAATAASDESKPAALPGSPVFGDVGKVVDPSTLPALRNVLVAGTEVRFLGDEYGLKAYFITNAGQGQVVYISPDNQASIVGAMFGGDGTPMSVMQLARLKQSGFDPVPFLNNNANPSPLAEASTPPATPAAVAQRSPGEMLLTEANRTSWIAFGAPTGRPITVFMDPNCAHCHELFTQLQTYVAQNKIYLRVIPVSVITPDKSRGDVINLLSSADPAATWSAKVAGTAIPAPAQVNPQAEGSLAGNNLLFTRWQLGVTPYSIYRNNAGEVKVLSGNPNDMKAFLGELGITQ